MRRGNEREGDNKEIRKKEIKRNQEMRKHPGRGCKKRKGNKGRR